MKEICEEIGGDWEDEGCEISDLTETERDALHQMQLGIENIRRADGALHDMHHLTGRGMSHMRDAVNLLEESDNTSQAERLRSRLPEDAIRGMWTYEMQERWTDGFFNDITETEKDIRQEVSGGRRHVNERLQKINQSTSQE